MLDGVDFVVTDKGIDVIVTPIQRPTYGRAPFPWYGGKENMLEWLVSLLPRFESYDKYIEVFSGSAVLLLNKRPSPIEYINDIDEDIVNFFRVLRDKGEEFIRLLALTPYSRREKQLCTKTVLYKRGISVHIDDREREYITSPITDVERARRWYIAVTQGFSGNWESVNSWGYSVKVTRGVDKRVKPFNRRVALLPFFIKRLKRVFIECVDWRVIMDKHDSPRTLFYLDPPYPHSTRTVTDAYANEMSDDDHRELIRYILSVRGMVMISSYPNDIYEELTRNGWKRYEFRTRTSAANARISEVSYATEVVWCNPQLEANRTQLSLF